MKVIFKTLDGLMCEEDAPQNMGREIEIHRPVMKSVVDVRFSGFDAVSPMKVRRYVYCGHEINNLRVFEEEEG